MWEQEIVVGSYMSIIIATLDCGSLTQWVEIMSNRVHRHFFFFFLFCCSGNVANSSSSSLIRDKPTTASKKKKEKKKLWVKNVASTMSCTVRHHHHHHHHHHTIYRADFGFTKIHNFFFLFLGFSHNFFAGQRSRPSHPKLRNTATATTSTHWISFAHLLDSDCHKFLFISPPITAVITGRRGGWQFSTFYLLI